MKTPTVANLSRASLKKDMAYIGILVFIVMTLMFWNFWYTAESSRNDKNYIRIAGELRILSQAISKHAASAIDGMPDAFVLLKSSRDSFDLGLNALKNGEPKLNLPGSASDIRANELLNVENSWRKVKDRVNIILSQHDLLTSVNDTEVHCTNIISQIESQLFKVMDSANKSKEGTRQVFLAAKQSILAERILKNITKVIQGKDDIISSAEALKEDLELFSFQLQEMKKGASSKILKELDALTPLYSTLSQNTKHIISSALAFASVQKASVTIYKESQNLLDQATILSRAYMLDAEHRFIGEPTGYMLGATGLLLLVWLGYRIFADTKESLALTDAQNKSNQEAVAKLLKELENLAKGDLSVHTSLGAEMTHEIAASVNSAIDALRRLVFTINDTALQVSSSTQAVQATSKELTQATENQSAEIMAVNAAMNTMATSAEDVADHAIELSQVAQSSVVIAKDGVNTVQNTILGMERMRGYIQETSKKMKRLEQSTQEIGEMLSLINDITDQTNILALNASIQAAMAGEAGKGFAVVAEEVQRLAENASKATRQIEILVNAIQSDTNQTLTSMEDTTQEVVLGTNLAKDAGVALEKIERVSLNLADFIKKISQAAKDQVEIAGTISKTMDVILNITKQTTENTHVTEGSIGGLAELSMALKNSVAGFKLPEQRQDIETRV